MRFQLYSTHPLHLETNDVHIGGEEERRRGGEGGEEEKEEERDKGRREERGKRERTRDGERDERDKREEGRRRREKKKKRERDSQNNHASIISISLGLQITVFILSFLSLWLHEDDVRYLFLMLTFMLTPILYPHEPTRVR
jgi:hypothetical protein